MNIEELCCAVESPLKLLCRCNLEEKIAIPSRINSSYLLGRFKRSRSIEEPQVNTGEEYGIPYLQINNI